MDFGVWGLFRCLGSKIGESFGDSAALVRPFFSGPLGFGVFGGLGLRVHWESRIWGLGVSEFWGRANSGFRTGSRFRSLGHKGGG